MEHPENLSTLGTQDTGKRKKKSQHRKQKRPATRTAPKTGVIILFRNYYCILHII